jgi:hypothetical protein
MIGTVRSTGRRRWLALIVLCIPFGGLLSAQRTGTRAAR